MSRRSIELSGEPMKRSLSLPALMLFSLAGAAYAEDTGDCVVLSSETHSGVTKAQCCGYCTAPVPSDGCTWKGQPLTGCPSSASVADKTSKAAATASSDDYKKSAPMPKGKKFKSVLKFTVKSDVDATQAVKADGQCGPVSYGCGSCCSNGHPGAYYINADCSTGCDTRCTNGATCQ